MHFYKVGIKIFAAVVAFSLLCFISPHVVYADTVTKTFDFVSSSEGFTSYPSGSGVLTFSSSLGNPAGSLSSSLSGRNDTASSYWQNTLTWEDMGVPEGSTVIELYIISGYTRVPTYTAGNTVTVGPYELRTSTGADICTLWNGRSVTAQESSWVAISGPLACDIPQYYQSSSTQIRLYNQNILRTANNKSASVALLEDGLSYRVTYYPPATPTPTPTPTPSANINISLTTDGSVSFGTMGYNSTRDTTSSGLNDVETIRVNGDPVDLDVKTSAFSVVGFPINCMELGSDVGPGVAKLEFSKDGSSWSTFTSAFNLFTFDTNVQSNDTRNLYLRLSTPPNFIAGTNCEIDITIVASAP
jgi:hypothetical protein